MPPDAVLFDCDGVLVDSEPVTDRVIIANLARYGLSVSKDEVTDLFLGGTLAGVGEVARARGADLPDAWVDEIYSETFDALRQGTPLIDGVVDLLGALDRAGIPYGVGSNGPRAKMEITLGQNGLWDRFKSCMSSAHDAGVAAKPAPDVYLVLARQLSVDPARCVVIDDSPSGARGGIAAGAQVIAFGATTPAGHLKPLGVPIARSMSEIADMIGVGGDQDRAV